MESENHKPNEGDYPYYKFEIFDNSLITVQMWEDSQSVEMHRHKFNEFALIIKGSCVHEYRGVKVPLMPGDVFFIEPDQPHAYDIQAKVGIINCFFYAEALSYENCQVLKSATASAGDTIENGQLKSQWDELLQFVTLRDVSVDKDIRQAYLNKQGIIHLDSEEMKQIEIYFRGMINEQINRAVNVEYAKSAFLQLILVILSRVKSKRRERIEHHSHQKKDLIINALVYIEENLKEKINFKDLADECFISHNYFRVIFKDVTGLTPVEYLNRMRIVKSLEYLEREKCTIAEAGEQVGIYDSNYYTRLFKKTMGYSPRYFKSITT